MADIPAWMQLGVAGLALAALLAGYKRLWVFGWSFAAVEKDRDWWRALALQLMNVNDKAISVADKGDG